MSADIAVRELTRPQVKQLLHDGVDNTFVLAHETAPPKAILSAAANGRPKAYLLYF
jgi:hypothetical protein